MTVHSPDFLAELRKHQARCDAVARQHGDEAPPPLQGEGDLEYRRRLVKPYQRFCPEWAKTDLSRADHSVMAVAEQQIYRAAEREAREPTRFKDGELVTRTIEDQSGRRITKFFGDPVAAWSPFANPYRIGVIRNPSSR